MKELSYDKWLELTADERVEDDAYWSTTGPKRKVPVLCDENLESDFVEALRGVRSLKLYRLPNGRGDRTLWDHARSHGLMLFTADGADFKNDRKFPLAQSPGVILIKGRTATEKMASLMQALIDMNLVECYRREGRGAYASVKIRACATTTFVRFVWNEFMVRYEWADRRGEGREPRAVPPLRRPTGRQPD